MVTARSRSDLLQSIHEDRAAWEELLATIPDERKAEPGLAGGWSVKDLIAHITVYERWTIEWLEPALEGNPPVWNDPDDDETLELDERNRRFYAKNRDRSLPDIQAEAAAVHTLLVATIQRLPEDAVTLNIRDLSPPVSAYYDANATVWKAIDENTAEHYRQHTDDVRRWLRDEYDINHHDTSIHSPR